MPDPRPIPGTDPKGPQSGEQLKLSLRGLVERIEGGDTSLVANLEHLLEALTGPEREKWIERCPAAVLQVGFGLVKLGQDDSHHDDKQALAERRQEHAESATAKDRAEQPRAAGPVSHTAECGVRQQPRRPCDCMVTS